MFFCIIPGIYLSLNNPVIFPQKENAWNSGHRSWGNKLHSIRILKLKTFKELFDMSVLADLLKIGGRKDLTTRILQRTNKIWAFCNEYSSEDQQWDQISGTLICRLHNLWNCRALYQDISPDLTNGKITSSLKWLTIVWLNSKGKQHVSVDLGCRT